MSMATRMGIEAEYGHRHPSTLHVLRYFAYVHLPESLQRISAPCAELARTVADAIPDGPELTAGLRKLVEAKDCLVRAAVDDAAVKPAPPLETR